jgi:outer membrane immunogenic protein
MSARGLGWVEEIDIDADVAGGRSTSYSADNELAYQIMAGIGYPLSENWTLSGELRYTRVNDVTFDEEGSGNGEIDNVDYDPISLLVGITYNF